MSAHRLVQIDAFAERPFTGNPAAVMPLEAWPGDALLQRIAIENNLSETAYFVPAPDNPDADFELCWFTPAAEAMLCGHATLATGHLLLSEDPERASVRFQTRHAGILEVRRAEDGGYELDLPAARLEPTDRTDLAEIIGTPGAATFLVDGDPRDGTAIVLLENAAQVRGLDPDFRALKEIPVMVIATAPGEDTDIVSRVFVSAWGIDEDPVTGSAHAALTPFWAARLGRDSFTAFQASARGGHLGCRLDGDRAVLGGRCVTVIDGEMFLPG